MRRLTLIAGAFLTGGFGGALVTVSIFASRLSTQSDCLFWSFLNLGREARMARSSSRVRLRSIYYTRYEYAKRVKRGIRNEGREGERGRGGEGEGERRVVDYLLEIVLVFGEDDLGVHANEGELGVLLHTFFDLGIVSERKEKNKISKK